MLPLHGFGVSLVYRNIKHRDKLIKGIKAGVLLVILVVRDGAKRVVWLRVLV